MEQDYQHDTENGNRNFGTVRVSMACPLCSAPLVVRRRRRDGGTFIGCHGWSTSGCAFTEEIDPTLESLAERVVTLEGELDAALRQVRLLQINRPASRPTPKKASDLLTSLLFAWHPDRRREPIAPHEATCALIALREAAR